MPAFNPKGSNYLKYTDPKTSQKVKDALWARYGVKYNWPKGGTTPGTTPGGSPPPVVEYPQGTVFGEDAGAFDAAGRLADKTLTTVAEDPRIAELLSRLNAQSQQGLLATENTALRESALQGINDALQVAQRQSALNAVGSGRPTGFDNPAIFNDYLRARGGLESDILTKNIDYKVGQQNTYGDLLTSRDNELFNRNYGRSQDVLGYATSGAGWSADQRQQRKANDFTQQAIDAFKKAAEAGAGMAGEALSLPGVSNGLQTSNRSEWTVGNKDKPRFKTSWNSGSNYGG